MSAQCNAEVANNVSQTQKSHMVRLLMLLVCFATMQNFALIAGTDK